MSALLQLAAVSKAFGGVAAVKEVSLGVHPGHILGLIGQNGAGKSTLMNIIGGVVRPDAGTMTLADAPYAPRRPYDALKAGVAFIHQELNLFTNLSIAENIFITGFPRLAGVAIRRRAMHERTAKLLHALGLDLDPHALVEAISPGERQLVEIAKALHTDARLIILDEPTTSLTARETERLFVILRRLREQGKALVYISHILPDVAALADALAIMRDGALVAHGPVEDYDSKRMIALMVGRDLAQLYPPRSAPPTAAIALDVAAVSAKGVVEDITFQLHRGEVLGLFGLMGSGRTELARILFGLDSFDSGSITLDGQPFGNPSARGSIARGLAFVTENRREEGLLMTVDIAHNIALVSLPSFTGAPLPVLDDDTLQAQAQSMAQALHLRSGNIRTQPAKALSGGNQQKVVIAKWLLSQPTVFIMDEPTRGIDVGAKYEIYTIVDQLAANGSGVLIISSEVEELVGLCDRILVMSQGEIVATFTRDAFDEEQLLRAAFREPYHHTTPDVAAPVTPPIIAPATTPERTRPA